MPILPLDHPEPFLATWGVMHYPGLDEESRAKARAFTTRVLAEPLRQFLASGGELPPEHLVELATSAAAPVEDWQSQYRAGIATGEMLKIYFALYNTDPRLASWANAQKFASHAARTSDAASSDATLYQHRAKMMPVAHLWAAHCLRDRAWITDESVGYDGWQDFLSFLTEAEALRVWGQTWVPDREKATPPLPEDMWRTPDDWSPPPGQPGWPPTGKIPALTLDPEHIQAAGLRPPGRPRNSPENPL